MREGLVGGLTHRMTVGTDESPGEYRRRQRRELIGLERFEIAWSNAGRPRDLVEREPAALTKLPKIVTDGGHTAKRV